jgi:malate dehydrogenase
MRPRVVIAGGGELGAEVAAALAGRDLADLVLVDLDESAPALVADVDAAAAAAGKASWAKVTASWDDAAGAGVVVLAGGDAGAVARALAEHCPDAIVVVAVEPAGETVHAVLEATRFPRGRVLGATGIVEGARLRLLLAAALGVAAGDVSALVLGGRGHAAVPILSTARVAGIPVTDKLPAERVGKIVAALRDAPAAGPRATAAAVAEIVDAVICDRRRVLACTARCAGELGLEGAVAGVPVVVGGEGIERILELTLDDEERAALHESAVR